MHILYIAYSCDPYNGSEDQIGWNIPVESFKQGNIVSVITKSEHERIINDYIRQHSDLKIKYYFIDIPRMYKLLLPGLLYSLRIILWQKRAIKLANKIVSNTDVDIIHQVAPVEFRALGDYGKFFRPYIIGPIGGGYPIPKPLNEYAKQHVIQEGLRKVLNGISLSLLRRSKKLNRSNYVFITNKETSAIFKKYGIQLPLNRWEYHCDIGISDKEIHEIEEPHEGIRLLFPGRLTYRKGHHLLLDAIPRDISESIRFEVRIAGEGPLESDLRKRLSKDEFLNNHVILLGKIPYTEIKKEYAKCDAVILPSLSEATGTVLIEGLSAGKPIITSNHFGACILADNSCAWLFDGDTKQEMIEDLRRCIRECICDESIRKKKASRATYYAMKYTWNNKVSRFMKTYNDVLENGAEQ